ncbi:DUF1304 family protein [Paenibacillus solisilvae]|uniref:DUF1304 family protein n=1 Tax=Paenibacillus solisilvae TaxID=2486751 RepID=A0ABW0VTF7_9BACL
MIAAVFVGLVAVEHIYILILEMFLWTTPRRTTPRGMTLIALVFVLIRS